MSSRKLYLAAGLALGTHSPFKNIPRERDSHLISRPNLRKEVWEGFGSPIWGCLCFVFVILEIESTDSHILGKSSVIATSLPISTESERNGSEPRTPRGKKIPGERASENTGSKRKVEKEMNCWLKS